MRSDAFMGGLYFAILLILAQVVGFPISVAHGQTVPESTDVSGGGFTLRKATIGPARRVIFIPGVVPDCFWVAWMADCDTDLFPEDYDAVQRSETTFAAIISHLTQNGYQTTDFRHFNYSSNWRTSATYQGSDTRQPLYVSASSLKDQIGAWRVEELGQGREDTKFDLITHSLGGAVAAYLTEWELDDDVLSSIHSITTLDSPVNGMFDIQQPATFFVSGAGQAGSDLQDAEIVADMRTSVWKIDLITYSDYRDMVVPISAALFSDGSGCPVPFGSCAVELTVETSDYNHSAIKQDPLMFPRIDSVMASDGPHWARRNAAPTGLLATQPSAADGVTFSWAAPICLTEPATRDDCGPPVAYYLEVSQDALFAPSDIVLSTSVGPGTSYSTEPDRLAPGIYYARMKTLWGLYSSKYSPTNSFAVAFGPPTPVLASPVSVSPSWPVTGDLVHIDYDIRNDGGLPLNLNEVYVDGHGPDGYWKAWACGGPNGQPACSPLQAVQTKHYTSVINSVGSPGTWSIDQVIVYDTSGSYTVLGTNVGSFTVSTRPPTKTTVCGPITISQTWTLANSPYAVTCDVTVNSGVNLTIEAGTEVRFGQTRRMSINGSVSALGTASQPILFTADTDTPAPGYWGQLYVQGGSLVLEHATVRYGGYAGGHGGVFNYGGTLTLANATLTANRSYGLYQERGSATITDSTVSANGSYGVYADNGSLTVSNSDIVANGIYGVYNAQTSTTLDAENSWWGSETGPAPYGPGNGINYSGCPGVNCRYYVDADP